MKAAVLYERRAKMIVEDVELKPPAPDEVRIRVKAAGVCHSDYHHWEGEFGSTLPLVLGHEVAGVVDAVGSGVTKIQQGDRVVLAFGHRCGECSYCLKGEPYICTPNPEWLVLKRFPRILNLYRAGKLKLKEMVSQTFRLEEINDAIRALGGGEVARGVVMFD